MTLVPKRPFKATFRRFVLRAPGSVEVESIRCTLERAGKLHEVYFYCQSTRDNYDGLSFNGTWFEDRAENDVFSSELFATLTGKYPHEIRETHPVTFYR